MRRKVLLCFSITFCLAILGLLTFSAFAAEDVPRITKEELKVLIKYTDITILDVRTGTDWKAKDISGFMPLRGGGENGFESNIPLKKSKPLFTSFP